MCSKYHHLGHFDEDCDGEDSYGVSWFWRYLGEVDDCEG
jgi:hypothetical protein